MKKFYAEGFNPQDVDVKFSEILIATSDSSDSLIDKEVTEVLALLKEKLSMDIVFVSEFIENKRVIRYVNSDQNLVKLDSFEPLEKTWCKMMVDQKIPEFISDVSQYSGVLPEVEAKLGTFISAPVVLGSGDVYGTVCCLSYSPVLSVGYKDLSNLKSVASLISKKIDAKNKPMTLKDME